MLEIYFYVENPTARVNALDNVGRLRVDEQSQRSPSRLRSTSLTCIL